MSNQIQYFQVANLIFIGDKDKLVLNNDEITKIQERFESIVSYFSKPNNMYYSTDFIKKNGQKLPFTSMVVVGAYNNHIILNFTDSFKKPLMLVINTATNCVQNYIDVNDVKGILQNDVYEDIKDELFYAKRLDRFFKGVPDINAFIEKYEDTYIDYEVTNTLPTKKIFQ